MPVLRYFLFVGGALLALLLAAGAYVPKESVVTAADAVATAENPTLRIRSDRKWPERIVFDTSIPTIVPPAQTASTELKAPAQAATSEFTAKARVRESFAQLVPPEPRKPEPQVQPQPKRKVAKHKANPPMMLVAQQPQRFGFFNTW
jgi:hypothetical protein